MFLKPRKAVTYSNPRVTESNIGGKSTGKLYRFPSVLIVHAFCYLAEFVKSRKALLGYFCDKIVKFCMEVAKVI